MSRDIAQRLEVHVGPRPASSLRGKLVHGHDVGCCLLYQQIQIIGISVQVEVVLCSFWL